MPNRLPGLQNKPNESSQNFRGSSNREQNSDLLFNLSYIAAGLCVNMSNTLVNLRTVNISSDDIAGHNH